FDPRIGRPTKVGYPNTKCCVPNQVVPSTASTPQPGAPNARAFNDASVTFPRAGPALAAVPPRTSKMPELRIKVALSTNGCGMATLAGGDPLDKSDTHRSTSIANTPLFNALGAAAVRRSAATSS